MRKYFPFLIGFFTTGVLLGTSFFLQVYEGMEPCPLCTLQRFVFIILAFLFLCGLLLYKKFIARIIFSIFIILFSITGIALSGRQVWLQHFPPPGNSECGVGLQYMMEVLPMHEVFQKIMHGSAECTTRGFEFLYLNMAEWSLIWFLFFFFLTFYFLIKDLKKSA